MIYDNMFLLLIIIKGINIYLNKYIFRIIQAEGAEAAIAIT